MAVCPIYPEHYVRPLALLTVITWSIKASSPSCTLFLWSCSKLSHWAEKILNGSFTSHIIVPKK